MSSIVMLLLLLWFVSINNSGDAMLNDMANDQLTCFHYDMTFAGIMIPLNGQDSLQSAYMKNMTPIGTDETRVCTKLVIVSKNKIRVFGGSQTKEMCQNYADGIHNCKKYDWLNGGILNEFMRKTADNFKQGNIDFYKNKVTVCCCPTDRCNNGNTISIHHLLIILFPLLNILLTY